MVLGFPTALFTFLLVVVVGYWLVVLFGALDSDSFDADADGDGFTGGTGRRLRPGTPTRRST